MNSPNISLQYWWEFLSRQYPLEILPRGDCLSKVLAGLLRSSALSARCDKDGGSGRKFRAEEQYLVCSRCLDGRSGI